MSLVGFLEQLGEEAVDLFAGPGGWEEGLRHLGISPFGIEWDGAACATRKAAGLRTLQADVSKLDPLDFAPVKLVIASAPCPTFSSAGKGAGRLLTELIVHCLHETAAGNDTRAERRDEAYAIVAPVYRAEEEVRAAKKKREPDLRRADDRARRDADMSLLVVEPLRWVIALEPRWVALEQVPEVLPLWSEIASILSALGYHCWTGVMEAERYGVPQTRERAILMADREAPVHPPRPTHQRYVKGEPQRHEATLEGEVLPWVSMAEALGWTEGARPSPAPTVSGGGTGSGGGVEVFAGKDARKRVLEATQRNGSTGEYGERTEDEPAFTVATNADRWKFRNGNQRNACERETGEPAPTIHFGKNYNEVVWVSEREAINEYGEPEEVAECGCFSGWVDVGGFCACCHAHLSDPDGPYAIQGDGTHGYQRCPSWEPPVAYDRRQQNPDGSPVPPVPTSEPAPTLTANGLKKGTHQWVATHANTRKSEGGHRYRPNGMEFDPEIRPAPTVDSTAGQWTHERPSTTVNGDPRISKPGRHDPEEPGSQQKDAIRVTLEEAAILQSFPPDYPFQGTKSKRFEQVGNAVPPLLAHAILSALLAPVLDRDHEAKEPADVAA